MNGFDDKGILVIAVNLWREETKKSIDNKKKYTKASNFAIEVIASNISKKKFDENLLYTTISSDGYLLRCYINYDNAIEILILKRIEFFILEKGDSYVYVKECSVKFNHHIINA
jgi:hypothetical protein